MKVTAWLRSSVPRDGNGETFPRVNEFPRSRGPQAGQSFFSSASSLENHLPFLQHPKASIPLYTMSDFHDLGLCIEAFPVDQNSVLPSSNSHTITVSTRREPVPCERDTPVKGIPISMVEEDATLDSQ